jgi:RNA polymerase sigma factor (sigma-70 family)
VVQDVCVRLLESAPTDPVREPVAFLRHISTHLAIDHYRTDTHRTALLAGQDPASFSAQPGDDPQEQAIAGQTSQALLAAIQALPPRCQEVFVLHRLYHVPQTDIAQRLGISRTMVTRHLARAQTALAPLLTDARHS